MGGTPFFLGGTLLGGKKKKNFGEFWKFWWGGF